MSSRKRSCCNPASVALTTLDGLLEPSDLLKISLMPADSSTARTVLPAMMPVPGEAGRNMHFRAAIMAKNLVRNGGILQGNGDHLLLGHVAAFADGLGDFHRLAQADADVALLVARDDQGAEAETASALDDLGGTIDENDLLAQLLAAAAFRRAVAASPA